MLISGPGNDSDLAEARCHDQVACMLGTTIATSSINQYPPESSVNAHALPHLSVSPEQRTPPLLPRLHPLESPLKG